LGLNKTTHQIANKQQTHK